MKKNVHQMFLVRFQAEEISSSKRFATSRLLVAVMAEDINPPVLQVTSAIGKKFASELLLHYSHNLSYQNYFRNGANARDR